MLRCACAHEPLRPKWEVRGQYRQRVEIKRLGLSFDFTTLDQVVVNSAHFGEAVGLFKMADFALDLLNDDPASRTNRLVDQR